MLALEMYRQQNGEVTKAYYAALNRIGYKGMLAVALFRAQKRSTAAKRYRGRHFKSSAYDVKNWSLGEICRVLKSWDFGYTWGWKRDPHTPGFEWVLYVDLPTGQASFHSAQRLEGPNYTGEWRPLPDSLTSILAYCDEVTPKMEESCVLPI